MVGIYLGAIVALLSTSAAALATPRHGGNNSSISTWGSHDIAKTPLSKRADYDPNELQAAPAGDFIRGNPRRMGLTELFMNENGEAALLEFLPEPTDPAHNDPNARPRIEALTEAINSLFTQEGGFTSGPGDHHWIVEQNGIIIDVFFPTPPTGFRPVAITRATLASYVNEAMQHRLRVFNNDWNEADSHGPSQIMTPHVHVTIAGVLQLPAYEEHDLGLPLPRYPDHDPDLAPDVFLPGSRPTPYWACNLGGGSSRRSGYPASSGTLTQAHREQALSIGHDLGSASRQRDRVDRSHNRLASRSSLPRSSPRWVQHFEGSRLHLY